MRDLVLASGSEVRLRLLAERGLNVRAAPSDVDEAAVRAAAGSVPPEDLATRLAKAKALAVSVREPDAWVVGADQLLVFRGEVLSKPPALAAARERLAMLRGRWHQFICGVAVARDGAICGAASDSAGVRLGAFSDAQLDQVCDVDGLRMPMSSSGYLFESAGARLVDEVDGAETTVLGLPMTPLLRLLRSLGAIEG